MSKGEYLPGLRCPECGDRVFYSTLSDTQVVCADMGHWIGREADCEKTDDDMASFERWYRSQEKRFASGMMSTEDIAYAAWVAGMERKP